MSCKSSSTLRIPFQTSTRVRVGEFEPQATSRLATDRTPNTKESARGTSAERQYTRPFAARERHTVSEHQTLIHPPYRPSRLKRESSHTHTPSVPSSSLSLGMLLCLPMWLTCAYKRVCGCRPTPSSHNHVHLIMAWMITTDSVLRIC